MKGLKHTKTLIISLIGVTVLLVFTAITGYAADEDTPERSITMAAEYPGIEIPAGDDVSMDIIFHNKGKRDENISIQITQIPAGWDARIKTYKYTITGAHVAAGKDKNLQFEAKAAEDIKPGRYRFRIESQTDDGRFTMSENIYVQVKKREKEVKVATGIGVTTSYPVLRGPVTSTFEFRLELESKFDQDTEFNISAKAPEGWNVNFKPAYESKYISSLRLKANSTKSIDVEVDPLSTADAGEYPIDVRITAEGERAEANLKVFLTGSYELKVGTLSGLLSLEARQGKPANLSIYVQNTGTATNSDISFTSFKPENWEVEFEPENIDTIEPGEYKQVEVVITPYEEALVGDYSVDINAKGLDASDSAEFRVTVKASTMWGWIGIAIIVVVIGGLTMLFRRFGRR
ncbi:MAG: hypothetical protein JSV25_15415 [Spirochaetota bacterium]|nr:MAG: hypothetical protein JSV25_15415 [Spirochaetota bacterium]